MKYSTIKCSTSIQYCTVLYSIAGQYLVNDEDGEVLHDLRKVLDGLEDLQGARRAARGHTCETPLKKDAA